MSRFEIADLPVAAGRLALCPVPGATGRYAADLAVLLDWAPDAVVTLTQADELAAAGAGPLAAGLQALGIAWHPFPIADFDVPGAEGRAVWADLSEKLRGRLAKGGRVLIHCRGGCGRSGMIALRLMIETGEDPDAALDRLRSVRRCAVETEAQMRWAMED